MPGVQTSIHEEVRDGRRPDLESLEAVQETCLYLERVRLQVQSQLDKLRRLADNLRAQAEQRPGFSPNPGGVGPEPIEYPRQP